MPRSTDSRKMAWWRRRLERLPAGSAFLPPPTAPTRGVQSPSKETRMALWEAGGSSGHLTIPGASAFRKRPPAGVGTQPAGR